ncbi:MAG: hypothetical protein VX675_02550, partial [Planctomycetota bacterium]|nr:hypothetical protein [Planctomycetota bacterium]
MNRPRFYSQLVVVLVAGLLFAGGAASCRKKAPPVAAPAVPPGPPPATQDEAEELEALRKREQELEALLAGLKADPGKSTIRQRLMGQLDSLDGRGMYSTVEEQLLRGEGGFRELLGFFRACDEER